MLAQLCNEVAQAIELEPCMAWLAEIARFDRYQASLGIVQAAKVVAQAATDIGLQQINLHQFAADGDTAFWTFQSPVAWTPTHAQLQIKRADGHAVLLDHAQQAFLLATYSAACQAQAVTLTFPHQANLQGSIVLLDKADFTHAQLLALSDAGALGFITAAPCVSDALGAQFSGRVELDSRTDLFGISVTNAQWTEICELAHAGACADVSIEIDRSAPMPAVSAVLPGSDPEAAEVWLTAHLCHPRPGANDNASGCAALLGVAATLVRLQREKQWQNKRSVRFIWAPEFVGTAAVLQAYLQQRPQEHWPSAVLNMDMVGENQALCDCPFIVERTLDDQASLLVPVTEHIVAEVFRRSQAAHGRWRAVSFLGYSDHALFAAAQCPAVQMTHWPDRYNHSAADTLDKVCPTEMQRSLCAASTLIHCVANDYAPLASQLETIVQQWCADEMQSLAQLVGPPQWQQQLRQHMAQQHSALLALLPSASDHAARPQLATAAPRSGMISGVIRRGPRWSGPINLRAMTAALAPGRRAAIVQMVRDDKRTLALLGNFALRANGNLRQDEIIAQTSFALRRPLDSEQCALLFEALLESGWLIDR